MHTLTQSFQRFQDFKEKLLYSKIRGPFDCIKSQEFISNAFPLNGLNWNEGDDQQRASK